MTACDVTCTVAIMISPEAWRSGGGSFDWKGHQIFHRVEGTGEPLLLIHGFPTASWDWAPIWPGLIARYRVLTLDMMGFGFSAKPRDYEYTLRSQADLFGALLEREGVTSYRIVAHDYGLTVAQELFARQGEPNQPTIVSACLLNGGLFPETHHARLLQKLLATPLGPLVARLASYGAFARSMRAIWGTTPPPEAELKAMWGLVKHNNGTLVFPKVIDYIRQRRENRERWVGAVVNAKFPVRLIDGLRDPISGPDMVARYRELVPNPDVVELPDVGHYPQLEAPDAVLAAVLEHFARAA